MPIFVQVIVGATVFLCAGFAAPPPRVEYTFTPILSDGVLTAVQVDLRFRGEVEGETDLRLPNEWGGQTELYRSVEGLSVVSGATMQETDSPERRVLTHQPAARIHVRYRVIQDWDGDPSAEGGNPYRPIVRPTYFHFIGDAALVIPDIDGLSPARVRARNLPRGWTFASDLEHPVNLGRANASIIVGGDFRIVHAAAPNLRLAIRGNWTFTDADLMSRANDIIAGQRRFWGDETAPYLVTVIELTLPNQNSVSVGGTGLGDAFAFFSTPNADAHMIARTFAHESMHSWIPGAIGGMPQEGEAANYWLSEGFTDFYTGRILVRDGVWTPAQFAEAFNRQLTEYARSSVRTAPNDRILADYWNNQEVQRLPYQRGQLLATLWDARLRAAGVRDFDDVVLEMRARARARDPLKAAAMFPIVAQSMGLDLRDDLRTYVEQGAAVLLPEDVLAPCGRIETRAAPVFHRGFDIAATRANNNTITGVDPALPAHAAGLRNGMVLIRRDGGEIGDAEQEIAYVVRDGQTERTIRYMPRGQGSYTLQQLVLVPDLDGDRLAQCVRVLGGAS